MRKNWDWLARRIGERGGVPVSRFLLGGIAVILLLATVWSWWPQRDNGEATAFFLPSPTATATRAIAERMPTPTSYIPTATPLPLIHVVQEGEVLGLIAEEYGTTVDAILQANGLQDPDLVSVGQELLIADTSGTLLVIEQTEPTPTPTAAPLFVYQAPAPLAPKDGATFYGEETRIYLQWTVVGILAEQEWYEVSVWSQGQGDAYRLWTRSSVWVVPAVLYPEGGDRRLYWDVAVVERSADQVKPISPRSSTRRFEWR